MKNKKSLSYNIFYNNKVLLILSLLVATIIWLYIAVEKNVPKKNVFYNLQVVADGEDIINEAYGYQCYGLDSIQPSVTVKGTSFVVGADDFKDKIGVSVDISNIKEAGEHTLPVKASISTTDSSIEITSVTPDTVNVYIDREDSVTKDIEVNVIGNAADGYVLGEGYTSPKSVKITGPAGEIKKISSVTVNINVGNNAKKNIDKKDIEYVIVTTDGSTLNYSKADIDDNVEVFVPVYKTKVLSTEVEFVNAPVNVENYIEYEINYPEIIGGVQENEYDSINSVVIKKIDISEIKPGDSQVFIVKAEDVEKEGWVIADDGITQFEITVTTKNLAVQTISVNNVEIINGDAKDYTVNVDTVTIVGPYSDVANINDETVLYIDMSSIKTEGGTFTIVLRLEDGSQCWIFGKPTATVTT